MAEACRSFNISRKTGYKWLRRYEKDGDSGLADQSRRPVNQATKLSEKVLLRIVGIRIAHKHWGADKIRAILKREHVFLRRILLLSLAQLHHQGMEHGGA